MNPIRNAVTNYIETRHVEGNRKRGDELGKLEPRIPVSQIGHCPRQALLEAVRYHPEHPLHAEPTHGFDAYVKEIMEAGNVWEHQTGKALAGQFDGVVHWEHDDPALRVRNGVWSGHIDFLIEECADFPAGAIIEHKATNPVNFQRKDRLPYPFHCMQVLMYRRLLQQKLQSDYVIPTYLYYRSWSNWVKHMPPPWPGDFYRILVTSRRWGGGCPLDRKVAGGRVWFIDPGREDLARMPATKFARIAKRGEIEARMIPTPEEDFFRVLDVPCWPAHERTVERLRGHLQQK